ncbi:MAG: hypothetical protein M3017_04805 [Actinomycetota bacterium]|nr:hypothetical protein [Actinomycetota bacterium]
MRYVSSYYPAGTTSLPLVNPAPLKPAVPLKPVGDGGPAPPDGPFRSTYEPGAMPGAAASAGI